MTDQEIARAIGENLTAARQMRGLTQAEVGAAVGVSPAAIYQYERGTRAVGVERLMGLARALRVPVITLLPEQEPDEPELVTR